MNLSANVREAGFDRRLAVTLSAESLQYPSIEGIFRTSRKGDEELTLDLLVTHPLVFRAGHKDTLTSRWGNSEWAWWAWSPKHLWAGFARAPWEVPGTGLTAFGPCFTLLSGWMITRTVESGSVLRAPQWGLFHIGPLGAWIGPTAEHLHELAPDIPSEPTAHDDAAWQALVPYWKWSPRIPAKTIEDALVKYLAKDSVKALGQL